MINLRKQFESIRGEVMEAVAGVLESTAYVLGPRVREFEEKVNAYVGSGAALGVAQGTDALFLALKALGLKRGDEVITTPFTFFATVEAICYTGARPVFVDIEPDTMNIDPSKIEEKITRKTKAILPVHIFGHPADMGGIMRIANKYDLKVVEDCAQSFGATVDSRMTGGIGDAGCFSFYPSKNLGAVGDAGLVTLKDQAVADTIRMIRNHGSSKTYRHDIIGVNSRLDEIQAAILLVKFKYIDEYNERRRQKADLYRALLGDSIQCPVERQGCRHVYHQFTILSPNRDRIQQVLKGEGVSSMIYYPVPMHLQKALRKLKYKKGDLPVAERVADEVLSLPICPELESSDIERIASIIRKSV